MVILFLASKAQYILRVYGRNINLNEAAKNWETKTWAKYVSKIYLPLHQRMMENYDIPANHSSHYL